MKMMRLFVLALLGVVLLSGCTSEEEPTTSTSESVSEESQDPTTSESVSEVSQEEVTTPVENDFEGVVEEFEGITFKVPSYAENHQGEEIGYPYTMYLLDASTGANFNVVAEKLPEPMELDEYVDLATSQTGFEYESNENTTINGVQWNESISLNKTEQGTVKLNQRTFMNGDTAYIFTYASLPDLYEQFSSEFIKITESVRIADNN